MERSGGDTFPMCFITMKKSMWKSIMNFEDLGVRGGLEEHYKFFRFNMSFGYEWGMDQVTFLAVMLNIMFCYLGRYIPITKKWHYQ